MKISSEFYDYKIFYTYEEYDQVELEPPWYDFDRKYVPNKVVVIVTVPPRSPGRTWKMKSADQAVKAANLWVNNAKLQLKDYRTSLAFFADAIANPALLAEHLFKKIWPTEAFMRTITEQLREVETVHIIPDRLIYTGSELLPNHHRLEGQSSKLAAIVKTFRVPAPIIFPRRLEQAFPAHLKFRASACSQNSQARNHHLKNERSRWPLQFTVVGMNSNA
nr:hypothetical protein Iba_chr06dCG10170 [Ipomoea batatas]